MARSLMLARWRSLLTQLGKEHGPQEEVAKVLGCHQTTVSKWMKAQRGPQLATVEKALRRARIDPAYLTAPGAEDLCYKPFLAKSGSGIEQQRAHPALSPWTATDEWRELPEHHRETLLRFVPDEVEPTLDTYKQLAFLLRTTTKPKVVRLRRDR